MATSGTYSWNLDLQTAILRAYQEINSYGRDDTSVSNNDYNFALYKLNGMLKLWGEDGIKVFKRKRAFLFPALNTTSYTIGSLSGSANCTNIYQSTTLTTAASASATTLTVSSTSGMTAADKIGIELDNGTRQWTTITVVNSSTSVSITTGLTSAAAVTNTIVTYTSLINRPLDILYGTTLDLKNQNNEVSIMPLSHDEYWHLPVKSTPGRPNNLYWDKVLSGARPNTSLLYLYPSPQNVYQIITFVYVDQIQDLSGITDDFDLPSEWLYPIVFNLGAELAYSDSKFTELEKIQPKADKMYELLKRNSSDKTPLKFKLGRN